MGPRRSCRQGRRTGRHPGGRLVRKKHDGCSRLQAWLLLPAAQNPPWQGEHKVRTFPQRGSRPCARPHAFRDLEARTRASTSSKSPEVWLKRKPTLIPSFKDPSEKLRERSGGLENFRVAPECIGIRTGALKAVSGDWTNEAGHNFHSKATRLMNMRFSLP